MKSGFSIAATAGLLALSACAAKPVAVVAPPPAAPPPPRDLIVLLADPDGSVGAADVTNPQGATVLSTLRSSTSVAPGQPPSPAEEIDDAQVQQLFGDALSAMPPAAQRFTLYFRFESEELTAESRAAIPQILAAVKDHPAPEVSIIGHTDTTGTPARNLQLGLRRARTARDLLVASALDQSTIDVTSHGEADLLIKTADEVFEPRNRRVDIIVR